MKRFISVFIIVLICVLNTGCYYFEKSSFDHYAYKEEYEPDENSITEVFKENVISSVNIDLEDDKATQPSDNTDTPYDDSDISEYASLDNKYMSEFAELAPTVNMSFEELVGDNGIYDLPEAFPVPETYYIIVDRKYQVVMVYRADENGEYTIPVRYMLCTTGANSSPSPDGTFEMKNYRVRYALFNNTNVYGQYWSLITGRIYFHSILYSSMDASTYTSSYNNLGKNVSHGCVRLTVPDARWIWYNCAPGTKVTIRKGDSSDTATALIREQLVLAKMPETRPQSMTGNIPWTDNWNMEDVPHDVEFIQGHQ